LGHGFSYSVAKIRVVCFACGKRSLTAKAQGIPLLAGQAAKVRKGDSKKDGFCSQAWPEEGVMQWLMENACQQRICKHKSMAILYKRVPALRLCSLS
jgi:hypothetical protein